VSFVGIVIALSSSSMVIRGGSFVGVGKVVIIVSSLSSMGIVSVSIVIGGAGSSSGLGFVVLVVSGMQHAGVLLHIGGTT